MKNAMLLGVTGALLVFAACGKQDRPLSTLQEAWTQASAPEQLLGSQFEAHFDSLPTSGRVGEIPWTDSYWPNYKRGLARRWQVGDIMVQMPSRDELAGMSRQEINSLSPAEKYDIYRGDFDYTLTRSELRRTSPDHDTWWGLCHGWAPASLHFDEPSPIVVQSPDGITIDFASSDIKALLTFAQQYNRDRRDVLFLALRCDEEIDDIDGQVDIDALNGRPYSLACRGVNPGALHIVLAEMIGNQSRSFIADIEQGFEVWNYPAVSYETNILSESDEIYEAAAAGTQRIIEVRTNVQFVGGVEPNAQAIGGRNVGQFMVQRYHYTLELDGAGQIIGGEWLSDDRPDFLWLQTPANLAENFPEIERLYQMSTDN